MVRNLVQESVAQAGRSLTDREEALQLLRAERPEVPGRGDYAVPMFSFAKELKCSPLDAARRLAPLMLESAGPIAAAEAAAPGFLNLTLSPSVLQEETRAILQKGDGYGRTDRGGGVSVQIEFVSANPTGPLTLANARGGFFGDALANVLTLAGWKVSRAYYVNDAGMQVLALGHSVLKDEEAVYRGPHIDALHEEIKERDPYLAGEEAARRIVRDLILPATDRMGIAYDEWVFESDLHKRGLVEGAVERLRAAGLTYEKDGALFFASSRFGDVRDRVVRKSNGWSTYLAADIAYHVEKIEGKGFDKLINIWGADHQGDVAGLEGALEALGHTGKLETILLQFVTLMREGRIQRMSKRAGTYVTVHDLLDEAGLDAARFFMLQRSATTHLNFDLELAKEQSDKNPVYYVQYAHARIQSILEKGGDLAGSPDLSLLSADPELGLMRSIAVFPEIIDDTAQDYQLQRLPQYALDLAASVHRFYRDARVLSEDEDRRSARIALVRAAAHVLRGVLGVMGVTAPDRMDREEEEA